MQDLFAMQICHSQGNILDDVEYLIIAKVQLVCVLVKVIEEAAVSKELSHHGILVVLDAHPHVEDDRRMQQFVDKLNLLNKMPNVPVPEPFFFDVFLHRCTITLTATSWPSHLPKYTCPNPPFPISLIIRI